MDPVQEETEEFLRIMLICANVLGLELAYSFLQGRQNFRQ